MSNYDEIQKALTYIDPHDRDVWVNTGYSIKNEMGDNGFDMWDQWSQQADNYNARSARNVWKSIKNPTRTIGSLFLDARTNGYRPDKPYSPPPPEEQARIKAEREAARLAEEKAQAERYGRVKNTAQRIWSTAAPADMNHPYLAAKGITDPAAVAGLRQIHYQGDHNLLVPVVYDREIVNMQSINQDGGKRFLSGGQVHGGFAVVGDAGKTDQGVVIAEGYATAASIHQAIGKPVIVAFNAGNMVAVSERLAKNLPHDVPVAFAVDNDATQTGMKKALQAASYFEGRAQVIEPEFTMKQIQQFQMDNGVDNQGRPKLPSDFNDLHRLAGIDAVREKMEAAFHRPEPASRPEVAAPSVEPAPVPSSATAAPAPMTEQDWAQVIAEEARLSGTAIPAAKVATPPAAAPATPAIQETEMNNQTKPATMVADETPKTTDNSIEYAGRSQTKTAEPYQAVDPDHLYGNGRAADFTPDRKHYEADFKHYEVYDPTTNIQYLRRDPKQIQADLDNAGGIGGYDGITHDGERVAFRKTEAGWEAPLPGKAPEPPALEKTADRSEASVGADKKAVTDLNYRIPPESIASRYVVADGKYLSAANMTTVLFVDSGKKISTAKTDTQTINDMLEVAKEKGWDSIKLSGSKEFKAMMYVAAESQGIRTSGYRPTPEDLALVEKLRQDRSLNSIEATPERALSVAVEPAKVPPAPYPGDKRPRAPDTPASAVAPAAEKDIGERIVELGNAPYRHNPENQHSPYIVLEREGKERTVWGVDLPDAMERSGAKVGDRIRLQSLGKQPVELEVPQRNEAGEVTGMKKEQVSRNLFKMEVVGHERDERREHGTQPDVEAISKADKMMAQSRVPTKAAINTSPLADTQAGVPLQAIGDKEVPSEVLNDANRMKSAALDTNLAASKANYMDKASKLSKPNKQHLEFYERNVMDTIRGVKGEARTLALTNYYEHTAKMMSGTKLTLPKPAQIPTPAVGQNQSLQAARSPSVTHEREQTPEIER